jgi:Kef-type K+ transport system membrane component KefB
MTGLPDLDLMGDLSVIIVAAAVTALLARLVRGPGIVAFLVAGVLLGPVTGMLEVTDAIEGIAEAGVVLLLFLLGLELSFKQIRAIGKAASVVGGVQMTLSAAIAFGISLLFGVPSVHALFIGLALMYSSTVVVVKLLEKKGDVDAPYGRISVGILLVEDLAVVVVLALVTVLGADQGDGGANTMRLSFSHEAHLRGILHSNLLLSPCVPVVVLSPLVVLFVELRWQAVFFLAHLRMPPAN